MDAVNHEIENLFPTSFLFRIPTEDIKTNARKNNATSDLTFVGGTNLLNGDIRKYRQWDLSFHNILTLSNIVLMGCGWWQYETAPITRYTRWALKRVLSPTFVHSVRDDYTRQKLSTIGIRSINTGCPSLWQIDSDCLKNVPKQKSDKVVFTLTDYNRNHERDLKMIEVLRNNFSTIAFFPQGSGDIQYLSELLEKIDDIIVLNPRLSEFNDFVSSGYDYIGTRLHTGIRAIQKSSRTIIIGIDNRAIEMKKSFNLPVVLEKELSILNSVIQSNLEVCLNIPFANISKWKEQFYAK